MKRDATGCLCDWHDRVVDMEFDSSILEFSNAMEQIGILLDQLVTDKGVAMNVIHFEVNKTEFACRLPTE